MRPAAILFWIRRRFKSRLPQKTQLKHRNNIAKSKGLLKKLKTFKLPQMLAYLRKIDPYIFEEILLTAFKEQGKKIERNHNYSGDGGLDGKVYLDGNCYLIQAKRYTGCISTEHVMAFDALISKEKVAGGLFIHTGRTPKSTRKALRECKSTTIVSGQKLVDLIQGKPFFR